MKTTQSMKAAVSTIVVAWRTQSQIGGGGGGGGFKPTLNLHKFFNCLFAKNTVYALLLLIKSKIFHKKTLKILH